MNKTAVEKIYVIGFLSTAALAAIIYVVWGPKIKPKRKVAKKDSCPGLLNHGNSCFLNAILQACSTSQELRKWLDEQNKHAEESQLSNKLLHILKVLNNEVDEGDYGSPYSVVEALRAKRWVISSDEQDAHELFEVLTQSLDEERISSPTVLPLFDMTHLEAPRCETCFNRWGTDSPRLICDERHTYQGLLASKIQCQNCHFTCPIKYDAFDCLSLSLPNHRVGPCDLTQLLNNFIKSEVVDEVECEGCTRKHRKMNAETDASPQKSKFNKQTFLGKLPPAICLHIQRTMWLSNGMACKRSDPVSFPEYLSLDGYTDSTRGGLQRKGLLGGRETTSRTPTTVTSNPAHCSTFLPPAEPQRRLYRLDAVIEHLGDISSGHFVTHRRAPYSLLSLTPSPNWLYTSDTLVKRTTWARVKDCTAYMLFYERVGF